MLRRLLRWFVMGVVLVGFMATGAAAQAPEGQVPALSDIVHDMSVHEQIALLRIFEGQTVARPEQWAVAELVAYIDPALFAQATFVEPAIITPTVARIAPDAVRWTMTRMTVHEQLALRARYGDVRLEPDPLRAGLAPYAALVGAAETAPAPVPAPTIIHRALSAMTPHERLALRAIYEARDTSDQPEIRAIAPYVRAMGIETAPTTTLENALAGLTIHERQAILAICEGHPNAPPWADDLLVTLLQIDAR